MAILRPKREQGLNATGGQKLTNTGYKRMSTLPDKLRDTAHKIDTGKGIKLCEETALMYQAADEIQRIEAENAELRQQIPQWIPVSEKLPEPNNPVLVYYLSAYWLNPSMSVALHFDGGRWRQLIGGEDMNAVLHWMPLPPPEQDK
jgi:hypothetical protein